MVCAGCLDLGFSSAAVVGCSCLAVSLLDGSLAGVSAVAGGLVALGVLPRLGGGGGPMARWANMGRWSDSFTAGTNSDAQVQLFGAKTQSMARLGWSAGKV